MSGKDFQAWMQSMGLSFRGAQSALGIGSRNSIIRYRTVGAPLVVALACAALSAGLEPWRPKQ